MKFRRIILIALGIVSVACLVEFVSAAIRVANQPPPSAVELANRDATSVARQVATINARNTVDVLTAVPTPLPTRAPAGALSAIARDITHDPLIDARLEGVTATIVYSLTAFDEAGAVLSAAIDLRHLAPRVFAETNAEWLVVKMESEFTDITGHDIVRDAFIFILSRAVNQTINWPNFNVGNLGMVTLMANDGSRVYVHPALQAAWDAYRARR